MEKERYISATPEQLIEEAKSLLSSPVMKQDCHSFLKAGHYSEINQLFSNHDLRDEWLSLLVQLVQVSGFHTGQLFKQRAIEYPDKPIFQTIKHQTVTPITFKEAWEQVQIIARALVHQTKNISNPVIGLFTTNCIEGVLVDLACLSFGFRIVPIPANSNLQHIDYILNHAGITNLFIGGQSTSILFEQVKDKISLNSIILFPGTPLSSRDFLSWHDFLRLSSKESIQCLDKQFNRDEMDEIATVMYTSGTTDNPKGIIFSQTNIISKRYARALAIPSLNSNDVLLSFLPLYHTFGRYLELMGSLFHGATYSFAESTMFKTLLKDFTVIKPTIFISIPKRWVQIYEQVRHQIPFETAEADAIRKTLHNFTGGQLRLGLSAAGFLDPDIFQFYQNNGIKLLSGYGMTEATGGITMTPVEDYVANSVGRALPGVELSLESDGELCLKGPYISNGYFGKTITPSKVNGWFHTGDIFKEKDGHYFIVDRKKEIYKNSRGQTISPQRIENLFHDFEAVKSVFLVGDMREYNTLLIYPDQHSATVQMNQDKPDEIREMFGSLVQSVNNFLSPFERIVNFAIIPRDFSDDHGELTPKNTFKRKVVLENFAKIIHPMYEKHYIPIIHDEFEIRVPKWLMREKSVLTTDIDWDGKTFTVGKDNISLAVNSIENASVQFGDFQYLIPSRIIDIEEIIKSPEIWLGNYKLIEFIGDIVFRVTLDETSNTIQVNFEEFPYSHHSIPVHHVEDLTSALRKNDYSLRSLHQAGVILLQDDQYRALIALNYLYQTLENANSDLKSLAIKLLMRTQSHPAPKIRIKSLEYLIPYISGELFLELLLKAYRSAHNVDFIEDMVLQTEFLRKSHFDTILQYLESLRLHPAEHESSPNNLIRILLSAVSHYGKLHPTSYIWARAELTFWCQKHYPSPVRESASESLQTLLAGFRSWLGESHQIAIDRDTGEEYTWNDVITFENNVSDSHRKLLRESLKKTQLLREAIFLFSKKRLIHLDDILHRGIWISLLDDCHGKSIYRVLVQTRDGNSFNFVININDSLTPDFFRDEIQLLIMTGSSIYREKLVEDFGGYWPEYRLYTEEYVQGKTLQIYLERNRDEIAAQTAVDRWQMRWLHFIWNGLIAYLEFYKRSDRTLYIANPLPTYLIVPEFDYSIGTRLVSISDRKNVEHFYDVVLSLYETYILKTEEVFPGLQRMADWELIFTTVMEVFKVRKGVSYLNELKSDIANILEVKAKADRLGLTIKRIDEFIEEIQPNGVLTKPVVFASLRYERWLNLNPNATIKARGTFLQELYKEYRLKSLLKEYPETRIRFFRMTCFKNASPELEDALKLLQKQLRSREVLLSELNSHLQIVVDSEMITKDERYFLTRLLFEHLDGSHDGELISWEFGDTGRLDLVSITEDNQGDVYKIRPPFHPKEIANFHAILTRSHLSSRFQQNHEFLFIINQNNHLVGGIYWKEINPKTVYIEKIVVRASHRSRLLSKQLLDEFFNRIQNRHFEYVTVGFFQAGLFYKHGFKIDKKFGGLVKTLSPDKD